MAGFSDVHVLLFPVATRKGPKWATAPMALRQIRKLEGIKDVPSPNVLFVKAASSDPGGETASPPTTGSTETTQQQNPLNLGWLMLPVVHDWDSWEQVLTELKELGVPADILSRVVVVSDELFSHVVNSNLEVRTSVAINPATGAAEEKALFTYEALPRGTVLYWDVTCRNPEHFQIDEKKTEAVRSLDAVHSVVEMAHPLLEHLGIGGMGTRGMGRLRVLKKQEEPGESSAPAGKKE